MAAVAMGVLNAHRRYFVPALAPMFFNVAAVAGGVVLLIVGVDEMTAVMWWAGFVVLGGLLQLLVQLPLLRRVGLRGGPLFDLRFRDPALRQVVRRMGPVVLSVAATNIMLVITTAMASRGDGWASTLSYAFRLVHLPIGLVGVALGTVVLAAGSRRSAVKDHAGLDDVVRRGLRLNWFLALPSAVGLFVLADPLVTLIFERGRFGPDSTANTAEAIRWYAGGVVFYAGVKAAVPVFLARGDTKTPMRCSLLGIGANLAVAFGTIDALGFRGLALAVAAGAATNYVALRVMSHRRHGPGSAPAAAFLLRCAVATGVMGGLGWLAGTWLRDDVRMAGGLVFALATLGTVLALVLFYFLVAAALGLEEGRTVRDRLRGRLGR